MIQSQINRNIRLDLADAILLSKAKKDLSFAEIADGTGLAEAFVTAALLGQQALPADAARLVGAKLDLDEDAILLLQMIPLRGCIDDRIPTDPTMYRFYEMLQVYGTTLKALVHEKFGDGIISAINFKLDVKKVADPEGGERAVITLDGKYLRFGGEVMKNVAGYDLSRLMAGSYGCLGVLTEISMKVLPRPRASLSLRREISLQEAMNEIAQWQLQPLPISGLCYFDNALWIRLEGGEGSVKAARELLGGEEVAGQFWQQLREQQLPFFSLPGTLWRISLPSDAPMMDLPGEIGRASCRERVCLYV